MSTLTVIQDAVTKLADDERAEDERNGKRGEARKHCAQRDVIEHVEKAHVFREPLGEFEQHQ